MGVLLPFATEGTYKNRKEKGRVQEGGGGVEPSLVGVHSLKEEVDTKVGHQENEEEYDDEKVEEEGALEEGQTPTIRLTKREDTLSQN